MRFRDRSDAGRALARALESRAFPSPVVYAIPRGGVVVAAEVARALVCPLYVVVPRKIGAPFNPELAIGAVAPDGTPILNHALVRELGVSRSYIEEEARRQAEEAERRQRAYGTSGPPSLAGKTALVIDDGIATGYTALAVAGYLRQKNPDRIVLAVPVAPPDTVPFLEEHFDEVIALDTPVYFQAVGQFYDDFPQVSDQEVIALLTEVNGGIEA